MKPDWTNCPLCGSTRIVKKIGSFSVKTRDGAVRVPRVRFHECEECGERFFDYEASKTIDEYCLQRSPASSK